MSPGLRPLGSCGSGASRAVGVAAFATASASFGVMSFAVPCPIAFTRSNQAPHMREFRQRLPRLVRQRIGDEPRVQKAWMSASPALSPPQKARPSES